MNYYLQYNPTTLARTLSENLSSTSGSITTDIPFTPTEYILSSPTQRILKEGEARLRLFLNVSGKAAITPLLIKRENIGGQNVETLISANSTITQTTTYNGAGLSFNWYFNILQNHSLEGVDLVLRLLVLSENKTNFTVATTGVFTSVGNNLCNGDMVKLTSVTGFQIGGSIPNTNPNYYVVQKSGNTYKLSLTAGGPAVDITQVGSGEITAYSTVSFNNSYIDLPIVIGEEQNIEVFTIANFSFFQKTERIFLYTKVHPYNEIILPVNTKVISKENVELDYLTKVNTKESVEVNYNTKFNIQGLYNNSDPHVKDIELGNYVLPVWSTSTGSNPGEKFPRFYLREKKNLSTITDTLLEYPDILYPPTPPYPPSIESSLQNTAEKMIEIFEMLKLQDDYNVPGENFKVIVPTTLNQGSMTYRSDRWQLPIGYTDKDYYLQFFMNPSRVNPINPSQNIIGANNNTLWFLMRHVPYGAYLSAYHGELPGRMILKRKITSVEEVIVWFWNDTKDIHLNSPVRLYARNPLLQRPGFLGSSAALMLG